MTATLPTYNLIRASTFSELAQIFHNVFSPALAETISRYLLFGVNLGSIEPSAFRVWLGVSKSPVAIQLALRQERSIAVRQSGIQQLGKNLKSARWRETWDGLGGAEGLLDLLSGFSVLEVKAFSTTIRRSIKGPEKVEKEKQLFQLLQSLLPKAFLTGDACPPRNPDERPLAGYYEQLVHLSSPEVVGDMLVRNWDGGFNVFEKSFLPQEYMIQHYSHLIQPLVLETIFQNTQDLQIAQNSSLLLGFLRRWPSAQGNEPNFSASMQFSLDLLRRLASEENSNFPNGIFIESLVEPMLKKCRKRKVDWTKCLEIVQLTVTYLSRKPDAARGLSLRRNRLVHWVAKYWSHHPAEFEGSLKELVRLSGKGYSPSSYMFQGVQRSHRFTLLRLCMDSVGKGDIQKGEDVANMNFKWNLRIFMWLEKEHAWELYKRLRSQGETLFVGDPDIILSHFLQWRGKEAEVLELGIRRLEERKTQATSSRDQNSRASFAKDALYWAVATGSLRVYKEAHLWARRFIRDPLTVPELYRSYSFEAKSLLSGSPWNLTAHNFANSDLRARIDEANEVLWDLTENLFTALREPSFNLSFWSGTLELFSDVVNDRQKQYSKSLKKVYNLSEDEIYSIIWEDTLRLLLKVEKAMLEPGHERLMMNRAHGILKIKGAKVEDALPSTYRFFDELAKARDQMWRDYRPTILSATASLPEPYPRGLPIQHLTGAFKMIVPSPEHLIPYIASRAHTVLFLDPAKALERYPEDEETQAAIGKFVDCYQTAVELQIPSMINVAERKRRYQEIWAHALGPLSQGRMDTTEAFRYWIQHQGSVYGYARGVPQFWPHELYSHNPLEQLERPKHDPRVPQVEDASEVVEWNPLLPSLKPIQERKLGLTYIDIAKEIDDRYVHDVFVGSPLGHVNPVIPAVPDYQLYYDTSDYSDMARDEAHMVSALLFLDTRNTATRRILSSPFPSEDHIRYPSMYLDEQFLSKGKMTVDDAFRNLELNWARVPPTLLHELTRNSLEALYGSSLSRSASIEVENIAFGLVRLLGLSDRPDLASDLAIETIIRRPDASSWHRQLLSPTFLHRLPPAQSRACITAFANTIITRVIEKAETGEEEGNKSTEKYVKVTTVKHLAQLLNEANYIDQDFAIETLRRLLHAATHPDIRASVLQSLLSMLSQTEHVTNEKVLVALESLIPIAGSLNSRSEVSEEAWQAAEQTVEPIEIPQHQLQNNLPPILDILVASLRRSHSQDPWQKDMKQRVLLPIVDLLKENTSRWLKVFLRKHHTPARGLSHEDLPDVPLNWWVWQAVLETGTAFLPVSLLDEYAEWERFNINPPAAVARFNERLRKEFKIRPTADCEYFLALFDNGTAVSGSGYAIEGLLLSSFPTSLVQRLAMRKFEALLDADDTGYSELQSFIARFKAPLQFVSDSSQAVWVANKKPLVEEMINHIESLRTEEWMENSHRSPMILPETFGMKLWLLPYPALAGPEGKEEECKVFAAELMTAIKRICDDGIYHRRFEQIKHRVLEPVSYTRDRCVVALNLGQIRNESPLIHQLGVELADGLLSASEGEKDEEVRRKVYEMVSTWMGSGNEEVRRIGCGIASRWKTKDT